MRIFASMLFPNQSQREAQLYLIFVSNVILTIAIKPELSIYSKLRVDRRARIPYVDICAHDTIIFSDTICQLGVLSNRLITSSMLKLIYSIIQYNSVINTFAT